MNYEKWEAAAMQNIMRDNGEKARRIAALESRLKEAEAIIKELDAEIPSSTVMFYGWLGEVRCRAAAFLAGGDTDKI